jgi:hypothetical protein
VQRSRDFHKFAPRFGHPVSSHRQSPNQHPARATYPKCLVFPRGIAFAVPERNPMQLVVCFSIDHPKRGKFSRNSLLSQVVLSMEVEAGPQPRKGSPRRLASSRTVSRAGLGTPTSQAKILGFSSERPRSPRKSFEHSGDYCAQNCVPILQPSRNSATSSGDCQVNGRRPRRKFREHLPLPADAPIRCGSRGYRFNVARHQR